MLSQQKKDEVVSVGGGNNFQVTLPYCKLSALEPAVARVPLPLGRRAVGSMGVEHVFWVSDLEFCILGPRGCQNSKFEARNA